MLNINTEIFYETIGTQIRDARISAGISQEDLAKKLDLTRASIINIEKGRHRPSLHLLLEIADFLMIDYTSLIPVKPHHQKSFTIDFNKMKSGNIVSDESFDKLTRASVQSFMHSL